MTKLFEKRSRLVELAFLHELHGVLELRERLLVSWIGSGPRLTGNEPWLLRLGAFVACVWHSGDSSRARKKARIWGSSVCL
jgi:hypothetical protein